MITLKTCVCGMSHDARRWARLSVVAKSIEEGREVKRRRCDCGRILTVTSHEDDCAVEIDSSRYDMSNAYARARFEVALLAAARANNFDRRLASIRLLRAEGRAARDRAHILETTLASIYRARELIKPTLRLGRNLAIVEKPLEDEEASVAQ